MTKARKDDLQKERKREQKKAASKLNKAGDAHTPAKAGGKVPATAEDIQKARADYIRQRFDEEDRGAVSGGAIGIEGKQYGPGTSEWNEFWEEQYGAEWDEINNPFLMPPDLDSAGVPRGTTSKSSTDDSSQKQAKQISKNKKYKNMETSGNGSDAENQSNSDDDDDADEKGSQASDETFQSSAKGEKTGKELRFTAGQQLKFNVSTDIKTLTAVTPTTLRRCRNKSWRPKQTASRSVNNSEMVVFPVARNTS